MKKVAILFDAIRNEQFAIAVKSDGIVTYYGAEGQAREWADWANSSTKIKSAEFPSGVILGVYKDASDIQISKMVDDLGYSTIDESHVASGGKSFTRIGSYKTANNSKVPGIFDTPMSHFNDSQYFNAVNYKGLALRMKIKQASALYEVRVNQYAFNESRNYFIAKPLSVEEKTLRPRFEKAMTRGLERRLGQKVLHSINEEPMIRTKVGAFSQLETKSAENGLNIKSIGQRIGGGTRSARRAARFATAMFDPNAWDGDGDGLVQEGTPFERPAIPGVNDRSTGGNVDTAAAARAWEGPRSAPERGAMSRPSSRARTEQAQVEQVSRGMSSRAERARVKNRRRAIPGKDKVAETDGLWWQELDDAQRSAVEENLQKRLRDLERTVKNPGTGKTYGRLEGWWEAFVRANSDKTDSDGNPYTFDSKITGFARSDLDTEIRDIIDAIDGDASMTPEEKAKAKEPYQKLLDDILVLSQMEQSGDYSLLEHLHSASRKAGFGIGKRPAGQEEFAKVDNPPKGVTDSKILSSIHGSTRGAVIDPTKEKKAKRNPKLKQWVRNLSEENPRKAARRAARKAKRRGKVVGTFTQAEGEKDTVRRRIRRARRQIAKRKKRDSAEAIEAEAIKNKEKSVRLRPDAVEGAVEVGGFVTYDPDGKLIFTKDGVLALFDADRIHKKEKRPKSTKETKEATFIASLWDAIGFNGTPTLISEDEVELVAAAGWTPIHRGHGEEFWAEDWLYDPSRFITGQGGEMYGAGEYWGLQGSTWQSYISDGRRTGTLAWLPPSARIITQEELGRHRSDAAEIGKLAYGAVKIVGGKDASVDKDALLAEWDRIRLGESRGVDWDRPMGQLYTQLFDQLRNGDITVTELQNALKILKEATEDGRGNYLAPILGFDAIRTKSGADEEGPILVMNRSALVALDRGVTKREATSLGKDIPRAPRRVEPTPATPTTPTPAAPSAPSPTPAPPAPPRVSPSTPAPPAAPSSRRVNGRLQLGGLRRTGGAMGSQAAGQYQDPATGESFYVKSPKSKLHGEVEVLGSRLMELLGLGGIKMDFADDVDGSERIASTIIPLTRGDDRDPAFRKKVEGMFVGLAWLANWDSTGNPANLMKDSNGDPIVVDHGGSLIFRAQGGRKTTFGADVTEMDTMRDPRMNSLGAVYWGSLSEKEIARQVKELSKITDKQIIDMVTSAISDPAEAKAIATTLMARRDWLVKNWSRGRRS